MKKKIGVARENEKILYKHLEQRLMSSQHSSRKATTGFQVTAAQAEDPILMAGAFMPAKSHI